MNRPTNIGDTLGADPMFSGAVRERTCECGRRFAQRQLSERFMLIVERRSKQTAALLARQIPELYVPVHCPACERRDIGHQASLDDSRDYPQPFGERHDAA